MNLIVRLYALIYIIYSSTLQRILPSMPSRPLSLRLGNGSFLRINCKQSSVVKISCKYNTLNGEKKLRIKFVVYKVIGIMGLLN